MPPPDDLHEERQPVAPLVGSTASTAVVWVVTVVADGRTGRRAYATVAAALRAVAREREAGRTATMARAKLEPGETTCDLVPRIAQWKGLGR